jgi:hypothetical protein
MAAMVTDVNSSGDGKDEAVWMVSELSRTGERQSEETTSSMYGVGGGT